MPRRRAPTADPIAMRTRGRLVARSTGLPGPRSRPQGEGTTTVFTPPSTAVNREEQLEAGACKRSSPCPAPDRGRSMRACKRVPTAYAGRELRQGAGIAFLERHEAFYAVRFQRAHHAARRRTMMVRALTLVWASLLVSGGVAAADVTAGALH